MIHIKKKLLALGCAGVLGMAQGAAMGEPPAAVADQPAVATQADAKAKGTIDKKAQKVIDRYNKAVGGVEAIKAVKGIHQTGTFSMPAAGLTGKTETKISPNGKFIQSVDIPGFGLQAGGFDGTHGWMSDPMNGPQLVTGTMLSEMQRDSDLLVSLRYAENYATVTYGGEEEFYGQQAVVIKLVDHDGKESTQYFDAKTGLQIGQKAVSETPMGEMEISTEFKDYAKFGDLLIPKITLVHIGPMEQTMTIETVETGEIDDAAFTPPAPVLALIEAEDC